MILKLYIVKTSVDVVQTIYLLFMNGPILVILFLTGLLVAVQKSTNMYLQFQTA